MKKPREFIIGVDFYARLSPPHHGEGMRVREVIESEPVTITEDDSRMAIEFGPMDDEKVRGC